MTTQRCFVGLPLPGACQQALDAAAARLGGGLSSRVAWTRSGNWHVTLKFLGEVDRARLPEVAAALRGVRFASFGLSLGGPGAFPPVSRSRTPSTLFLGLAQGAERTTALAGQVSVALAGLGLGEEGRGFHPHVTLGRVKDARQDDWADLPEGAGRAGREGWGEWPGWTRAGLSGLVIPAGRASSMVLWRSILGPGGPKYAALEVFPARG